MLSTRAQAIILAAGKSTRFNTGRTKLLEKICGQEMIIYLTRLFEHLSVQTTVVVGYQKEAVIDTITKFHSTSIHFITQLEQQGTGHALQCTQAFWQKDHIIIINGDIPLVSPGIIKELFEKHESNQSSITFAIAHNPDLANGSYGRIVKTNNHIEIIEARDFTGDPNEHCCINAGIYIVERTFLQAAIASIEHNKKSNEFYITDLVKIASTQGNPVSTVMVPFDMVRGINTFQELWAAEQVKRAELIKYWMDRGVHFSVAQNVHIDLDVLIGPGTYIGCGVHLQQGSVIGKNCKINEFSSLENSVIGDNSVIYPHCIIKDAKIGSGVQIGPFAHVRENSVIDDSTIIGNFVEIKNCTIGKDTKAKHLSYLGDASIGNGVNIGAGTITCNHNGRTKHKTIVKDKAYIGSNNTLVAPVMISEHAFTAAGSVITDDVPAHALAVARTRQINKENYARVLKMDRCNESAHLSSCPSFVGAIKTKNSTQTT